MKTVSSGVQEEPGDFPGEHTQAATTSAGCSPAPVRTASCFLPKGLAGFTAGKQLCLASSRLREPWGWGGDLQHPDDGLFIQVLLNPPCADEHTCPCGSQRSGGQPSSLETSRGEQLGPLHFTDTARGTDLQGPASRHLALFTALPLAPSKGPSTQRAFKKPSLNE